MIEQGSTFQNQLILPDSLAIAFELDWLLTDRLDGRRGLAWDIKLSLPFLEFQTRSGDLELESSWEQTAWLAWNLTVCLGYKT